MTSSEHRLTDDRLLLTLLAAVPERALETLASSLRGGALRHGLSLHGVGVAVGPAGASLAPALTRLADAGWSPLQLALLIEAHRAGRTADASGASLAPSELVLSGPEVGEMPSRDTASVFRQTLRDARQEILVTGYAVHAGSELFAEAAARLDADPSLSMTIVVDFRRGHDTTTTSILARRRSEEFWKRHWPRSERRPRLLYDPRGLDPDPKRRAAMHAKVLVADRRVAFISSANLTERAQARNIEVGVLMRDESIAAALAAYFEGLERRGTLLPAAAGNR